MEDQPIAVMDEEDNMSVLDFQIKMRKTEQVQEMEVTKPHQNGDSHPNGSENGNGHVNGIAKDGSGQSIENILSTDQVQQRDAVFNKEQEKAKLLRLKYLLEKTSIYSTFLAKKINKDEVEANENGETQTNGDANGNKRKHSVTIDGKEEAQPKKIKGEAGESIPTPSQPALITGGEMRPYQLRGVEWLISLYENGLNGILADEMGLGKTIQCISLFAHLFQHGVKGPFLVVGPMSTLGNWVREIQKWAPTLPVVMYHGSKDEREQIRSKSLKKNQKVFPIVITSYEIVMRDRKYLSKFKWKYIVVDEGHRIKNLNCKLVRELKAYTTANRLLLTGTPLQNNLSELWSLLNFLLPDIFDDLDSFQSWFDFSEIGEKEASHKIMEQEESNHIVSKLHQILRPFLLRRVKTDVELELPSKHEKIVMTKLTELQQTYYKAIVNKTLPEILSAQAFQQMKNKGSSLQNMLMQLRKCCNHPYLFEWPTDASGNEIIDRKLITASGKTILLERLLPRMKTEGSKVLIFSQFTAVLNILEDLMSLLNLSYRRIDGTTTQSDRETRIKEFNTEPEIFCFLLSTRAGGLGINLASANIVIFYDNDWNPQMDLQAQDRAHRIGQTKKVRVYKFVTANSVESKIVERANSKMKLERLVIQKGNFRGVGSKSAMTEAELKELLDTDALSLAGVAEEVSDEFLFNWENEDECDERR